MYSGLIHAHSGLRWIALILIVISIINCAPAMTRRRRWTRRDARLGLAAVIAIHLQVILGLVLYFQSPNVQFGPSMMKTTILRFFTVEHIVLMVLAVVLITIGNVRAKRREADSDRFKSIFWFFLIGLLLLIAGIPWPFRDLGAGWF